MICCCDEHLRQRLCWRLFQSGNYIILQLVALFDAESGVQSKVLVNR